MKTAKDVDLSLSFSCQKNCSLGTQKANKRYIFNHRAAQTGQLSRAERGAVNVLPFELYFIGFKITDVNIKFSQRGKFYFYIVDLSWNIQHEKERFFSSYGKQIIRKNEMKGILAYFIINTTVNRQIDSCFGKVLKYMSHIRNTTINFWILKLSMYFSHLLSSSQRNYRRKSPQEAV